MIAISYRELLRAINERDLEILRAILGEDAGEFVKKLGEVD